MELPFIHLVLLQPDVALTDFVLSIETFAFAFFFLRSRTQHSLRPPVITLFLFLSASSLLGALYHGFFPLLTATTGGWTMWIATMLSVGGAATMAWILAGTLTHAPLQWVVPAALLLMGGYVLFLLFVDFHFWVSIAFSVPPLLALLLVFMWQCTRNRSLAAVFGVVAILLMFIASALQQMHIGIHPVYFNFNALYHAIQGVALALLFNAFRRML